MLQQVNESTKPFLGIINGNLVQKVEEGTPGAKLRKYELKDGTKGEKWEVSFSSWTGYIHGVKFEESKYGEQCLVDLGDAVLCLGTGGRYFQDFACKLFSADLGKEITLHPYNFESDGKKFKGISVQQGGVKLKNYFWDGKVKLHGFPEVDDAKLAKMKKTYWPGYFAEVTAFLKEQLTTLFAAHKPVSPERAEAIMRDEVQPPGFDDGLTDEEKLLPF